MMEMSRNWENLAKLTDRSIALSLSKRSSVLPHYHGDRASVCLISLVTAIPLIAHTLVSGSSIQILRASSHSEIIYAQH